MAYDALFPAYAYSGTPLNEHPSMVDTCDITVYPSSLAGKGVLLALCYLYPSIIMPLRVHMVMMCINLEDYTYLLHGHTVRGKILLHLYNYS